MFLQRAGKLGPPMLGCLTALFTSLTSAAVMADCPNGPPVNASDGLCSAVQLSWPSVSGATGYDVLRNTANTPTGGTQVATNIPSTFFHDGGAAPQTTYFYFVRARQTPNPFDCASGVGFWGPSNTGWAAGPLPAVFFDPQTDLDTSGCAMVIQFSTLNRGTVQLFRSVPPSQNFEDAELISSWTTPEQLDVLTFTDSSAPAGEHTYWFRRMNACSSSVGPTFNAERTFDGPPAAPATLTLSNGTVCDGVMLSWPVSPGAQFYDVDMFLSEEQVLPTESFEIVANPAPPGGTQTHIYQDPTNGGTAGPLRIMRMRARNLCGVSGQVSGQGYAGGNPVLGAPGCSVVSLGDPVTISCPVSIAFSYQWLRDGVPLSDDGRISGSASPTLQISSTVAADVGEYVLRVNAACGIVDSAAAVLAVRTDSACAADFDGNGTRDVTDIFEFLTAWFAGCP